MTGRERRIAERRGRVRELREQGLSLRQIGRRLGVHRSTVERDLLVPAPDAVPGRPVPNAAAADNSRALKHGLYSERRIAPVREAHARDLAVRYPDLDPGRRFTEAQRRSMIELASDWLDERGLVKNDEGQVFDVASKLAAWLTASERWQERVQDELRRPDVGGGVEALIEQGRKIIELREVDDGERS